MTVRAESVPRYAPPLEDPPELPCGPAQGWRECDFWWPCPCGCGWGWCDRLQEYTRGDCECQA